MPTVHSDAPLIRRCRQEALSLARAGIERCLDAARASLEEAVRASRSVAARYGLQDALERLERRRATMQSAFPAALDQAIAEAVDAVGGQQAQPRHEPGALPSDTELALLDDSQLSHVVEVARLAQTVQPVVEHALARLDSLMSSVLEQPVVRPDLNPMRPQVLCEVLMRMLGQQSESAEMRRLWLRHIAKPYARELSDLYDAVGDVLERESVQEAQYRVKLTEGGIGPVVVMGADAAPAASMPTGGYPLTGMSVMPGTVPGGLPPHLDEQASQEDLSDADAIRRRRAPASTMGEPTRAPAMAPQVGLREFLYSPQAGPQYDAPLPPAYYAAVRQQLAQMSPPQQGSQQAELPQAGERAAVELKTRAATVNQALGLDAVRALVAQVAGEPRLLMPVRQAVAALEPALLRLALDEPRFLGDGEHPARRFIEALAQRSFKYNDQASSQFAAFLEPVRQAVCVLDAAAQPSGDDFEQALQALQTGWQAQDQAEQQASEPGLRTMAFAQQRQQLADKIARDLSLRSDLTGAPNMVADFLFKDWSLVIAQAQLTHAHSGLDPGGYLSIVTDLLWSVKQSEILSDLTRLFEAVPRLIATLRKGLDALGQDRDESQALLDMLLRFHEPALRLRRMRSAIDRGTRPQDLAAMLQLPEKKDMVQPGQILQPQTAEQPWLGRREREITGFMDGMVLGLEQPDQAASATALTAPAPMSASPQPKVDTDAETAARVKTQLARLQRGDWVDLRMNRQWRRAELVWVSDNGSLYTFVSHSGQLRSMTRHTLEKLLGSGHARLPESGAVVEKALETIAAHVDANGLPRIC